MEGFPLSPEKQWRTWLSVGFFIFGGVVLIYSLHFPFLVSSLEGELTPTKHFLLPVYTLLLGFSFFILSYWSKHTLAWQAWGVMLQYVLLFSFCLPFLLPRSASYIEIKFPCEYPLGFYPDPWGGETFQVQGGICWFLAGTLLLTGGMLLKHSISAVIKIKKVIRKQGIFAGGLLIQEVSFFMFFNYLPFPGPVGHFFTFHQPQIWLALLAFPLFVYGFCEKDRRAHAYGLMFSALFAFTGYIVPRFYVLLSSYLVMGHPSIAVSGMAFSGVYVYSFSTCLLGISFFLHTIFRRNHLQQTIVEHSDAILSVYFFIVFLFSTTEPWLDFVGRNCVLARGLRFLFSPLVFFVILCLIAIGKGVSMNKCKLPPSKERMIHSFLPWLGVMFLSLHSFLNLIPITTRFPYLQINLKNIGDPLDILFPISLFLTFLVVEKAIILIVYASKRR